MIPKIVHQTWKSKVLPDILDNIYKYNQKINPDYEFKLWSHSPGEPEINIFLKEYYPELYVIFEKAKYGVQKGDIARLAILYHYGGIYIDLDIICLKSFNNLIDLNTDKLTMAYEPPEQTLKIFNNPKSLCNAFITTPSKHPLLKIAIDNIINIYKIYGVNGLNKFDIFGGGFMQHLINTNDIFKNIINIIDSDSVYPINDPKFIDLSTSKRDWNRLKIGYYGSKAILCHYWIHSSHEGKNILETFKCDKNKNIHENIFDFFCELYPNNYKTLL